MANRSLHPLLDYLRRLSGGKSGDAALDDAQLLYRFSTQRDESAFTALVQRYGAMVWGLCVRRLGETPEAEDAFQATFLVLVRKAASLREPQLAAGSAGQVLSAPLAALVEGVVRSMFLSKVKFVAFVVLALGLVGSGVGIVGHRTDAEQPVQKPAAKPGATPPGIVGKSKAKPAPQEGDQPHPAVVEEKQRGNQPHPPVVQEKQRLRDWRDKLVQPINYEGIDDPRSTLHDALEQLAGRYGIAFQINERAFKFDGIMEVEKFEIPSSKPIPSMKASLATVLKTILARIPATSRAIYVLRKDHVEITTANFFKAELGRRPSEFDREESVVPELALVWDAFEDIPVSQVLQRIADANGFNVVTDPRVAKQLQTRATAQFNNVPVETVVRLLVNMADVSMVRLDNVFYLTTEENAKHLREEQAKLNFEKTMAGAATPAKPASDKPAK